MAGRFVPGGTTAVGVSAGLLAYPLRRFVLFAGLGALVWTAYGVALAFLGRAAFPGNTWAGDGPPRQRLTSIADIGLRYGGLDVSWREAFDG